MRFVRDGVDQEVAQAARDFLTSAWKVASLRDELPGGPRSVVWDQAMQLGWADLMVGEEFGGIGLGAVAAGALLEESGRAVFPGPLIETVLIRGLLGAEVGDLPRTLTLAAAELGSDGLPALGVLYDGTHLHGRKVQVPYADQVEAIIVLARGPDGFPALVVVEPRDAHLEAVPTIDAAHRPCDATFDTSPARTVVGGASAQDTVERLTSLALCLVASRMLGVSEQAFDLAVEYATVRHQFGTPIGSFQAVRHRLAEAKMRLVSARSACYLAQARYDAGDIQAARTAQVAKAYTSRIGRRVVEDALQVHGGVGFTVEHEVHLYVQHALTLQGLWGSEATHCLALGDALLARAEGSEQPVPAVPVPTAAVPEPTAARAGGIA